MEEAILDRQRGYNKDGRSAIIEVADKYVEGGSLAERSRRGFLSRVRQELFYGMGKRAAKHIRHGGYSLIYRDTRLSGEAATHQYCENEVADRAFRKLKGSLLLRPIRVWTKEHIEGHVRVCYLAYAILTFLDYLPEKVSTPRLNSWRSCVEATGFI